MSLALLLALQPAPPAPPLPRIDFDLARVKPADPCETGAGGGSDIVVCGRRGGSGFYDLEKWERVFRGKPLVAEKGIGPGAVVRAYTESVEFPGGQISKRIMVGVRTRF